MVWSAPIVCLIPTCMRRVRSSSRSGTTPVDLQKGEVEVYNENFFIDLSNYRMEWELVSEGVSVAQGVVNDLDVAPQQRKTITLGYTLPEGTGRSVVERTLSVETGRRFVAGRHLSGLRSVGSKTVQRLLGRGHVRQRIRFGRCPRRKR